MKPFHRALLIALYAAICIICVIGLTVIVVSYVERPVVYKSWSTKECVRVEVAPNKQQLTCEEAMRGSYALEWVK